MLTDETIEIPNISYDEITGISPTYVPFRNGLMLSNAASIAQHEGFDLLYYGAHSEDAKAWAYPDCTPEFNGAMANAIFVGTYQKTRLITPLQWMLKSEIVELGTKLELDFSLTWSCYVGGELHCGTCPTCRARKVAFQQAGVADPTMYAA
jgi:7-cyano-7-deazaguanine synthase